MEARRHLADDEYARLSRKSDLRGWLSVATHWGLIAAAFAIAAARPGILTIGIALIVIGGRQLALAVSMHDCAHRALFRSPELNEWVGQWLFAAPVAADLVAYRRYHFTHHRTAGSDADPDRSNYSRYPVGWASLARKATRDLVGLTGLRNLMLVAKMNMGLIAYQLSYDQVALDDPPPGVMSAAVRGLVNLWRPIAVNTVLFIALYAIGQPWLYLVWVGAWLTTYQLFSRIRNAAEHGATPDINDLDPMRCTRTTRAGWLARLTIAPNHVNYHLEHHLLPTLPPYRLPAFHKLLEQKGLLKGADCAPGYLAVIRKLATG